MSTERILNHPASRPRIALYSHDTLGLGHVRRNLLLAQALSGPALGADVLILSGACEAQRFRVPRGVDFVALPAIVKSARGRYAPRRLRTSFEGLVALRSSILESALLSFAPHLVIVDNVPHGVGRELLEPLRTLKAAVGSRCVLGLRDLTDHPAVVRREWGKAGCEAAIRELYDKVMIYGDPGVYDRVTADGLAPDVAARAEFVGYLDQSARQQPPQSFEVAQLAAALPADRRIAACLVGGGQDGHRLAEAFAAAELPAGWTGVILTGPHLAPQTQKRLADAAARRADLVVLEFLSDPSPLVRRADRVVSMGGYNTVGEILSFEKRALIVPRSCPRLEQRIRAERLQELGLVDVIGPEALSPASIGAWLRSELGPRPRAREVVDLGALRRVPRLVARLLADERRGEAAAAPPAASTSLALAIGGSK